MGIVAGQCSECKQHFKSFTEYFNHGCLKKAVAEGLKSPVNSLEVRPDHYKAGGIEPWDYMEKKMTPEMFEGFLVGNVIKYVSRYHEKNGLEDLKKARTYLDRLIGVYDRFNV